MANNEKNKDFKHSRKLAKHGVFYALADFVVTFSIVLISFLAFYGFELFAAQIGPIMIYDSAVTLVTVFLLWASNIRRLIVNRTLALRVYMRIAIIVTVVHLVGLLVISFIPPFNSFGNNYDVAGNYVWTWLLSTATVAFGITSLRFAWRAIRFNSIFNGKHSDGARTLIIGAGDTGLAVLEEVRSNSKYHNNVIAFVDDDPNKIGGVYADLPVKGPISKVGVVIDYYQIEEVIIAINKLEEAKLHEIISFFDFYPVRVRRLPIKSETRGPNDIRLIDVDLNDLLYREPVHLDNEDVNSMLKGKTVLVTGAGGSIGSELVRQIFKARPKTLVLFDIYENSTYDIQMELMNQIREENITDIKVRVLIGSVYNEYRIEQVIKKYHPDYIYHAAAYKHVPLMEDSPVEAIRTNIMGTYNVARLADKYKVKKMVLVSTDKAVRPTNTMGATKAFAEMIIRYFAKNSKSTVYAAVRFGNVLGSNGSVVPLFKSQIDNGGPVTITDKNILRYFMTIPEAVSLILQCGLFAQGGEIFILDMGEPIKVISIAEKLIRQAGLVPYKDIDIIEIGLRPGEKLYEELLLDPKTQTKTDNKKIFIERKDHFRIPVEEEIVRISKAFDMDDINDIKKLLTTVVKDYVITNNEH